MSASGYRLSSKTFYLYPIISIALVLFILGLLAMFMLYAQALSKHFKENVELIVVLADDISSERRLVLEENFHDLHYVKSLNYVSKEEASRQFIAEYEEDYTEVLNINPLFASLNLYLNADYATTDSLTWIKGELLAKEGVEEVFYQDVIIDFLGKNVQKLGLGLIGLAIVFTFIAITLIDSTIRLAMFSNRFLIKSMQLVGATRSFITRPFITKSVYNGLIGGLLAVVFLLIVLTLAHRNLPELKLLYEPSKLHFICALITFAGILISWWSTRMAVLKYLKTQLDELY